MRKVLYCFSKLSDLDVEWFAGAGSKETAENERVLIQEGKPIDTFYITLSGNFRVEKKGVLIASIGAGEVLGELTFLDSRPPLASVVAAENAVILSIPVSRLRTKLSVDTGFASRFYFAIGVLLADRLRATVLHLAIGSVRNLEESEEDANEIAYDLLDESSLAAARFDKLRKALMP